MGSNQEPKDLGASRLSEIPFSGIRKVFEAVRMLEAEGKDIIHWQIGRTDFDTPDNVKQATYASMMRGDVHYAPNRGVPVLRKAIATRTEHETGVSIDPDTQVIVMSGANEGIMVTMEAFLNPGDEVLIPNPNWHHYKSCVAIAGGKPVEVETKAEENFSLNAERVASLINKKTKMICITSPANPTGCTETEENLQALADLAKKHNLIVLSDEIYGRIYYGKEETAPSIFSLPGMSERTIIINGFSKTYSMDGWRLGWTVASPEITLHLLKIRQYTTVCVNTFTQYGAAEGLSGDQSLIQSRIAEFGKRRDIIQDGLENIDGVTLPDPTGAFYAFPNISTFGKTSKELADYLLHEHGIATIAGSVFGSAGEGHVRIAYSCSTEECERGVVRLRDALKQL
ncbi:MAG: pyridoxal phosphate-dependent aminotransferase [Spirochaetota bacterium]